jgi:monofunctional biosynthetic peptidoglycan transglycosylase
MSTKSSSLTEKIAWIVLGTVGFILLAPIGLILIYRELPPPATPLMVIRLFEGEGIKKQWTPLSRISPHVANAVIALEDNKFCVHAGVDWGSVFEALADYYNGQSLRGASTISMQTSKNLFLWPGRNYVRKAIEAPLTILLESLWDKRRILEVYLNIAEWGPGIYGVEAAARAYFKKSSAKLSRREAALLAAVLPNPRRWSPARPTAYIQRRARSTRIRMRYLGPFLGCTRA